MRRIGFEESAAAAAARLEEFDAGSWGEKCLAMPRVGAGPENR
jgi:hypothetical protein